jgi:hypothetical protein
MASTARYNMKWKRSLLLSVILSFGNNADTQTVRQPLQHEQSEFGAEDENWERPVPVPEDILLVLRTVNHATTDEMPAKWLLASEIRLHGPEEKDMILMGIGDLRLPHAVLFWIFRQTAQGHELILSTGGDGLTVLNVKANGYRKIRIHNNTASATTAVTYQFDGHKYVQSKEKTEPI